MGVVGGEIAAHGIQKFGHIRTGGSHHDKTAIACRRTADGLGHVHRQIDVGGDVIIAGAAKAAIEVGVGVFQHALHIKRVQRLVDFQCDALPQRLQKGAAHCLLDEFFRHHADHAALVPAVIQPAARQQRGGAGKPAVIIAVGSLHVGFDGHVGVAVFGDGAGADHGAKLHMIHLVRKGGLKFPDHLVGDEVVLAGARFHELAQEHAVRRAVRRVGGFVGQHHIDVVGAQPGEGVRHVPGHGVAHRLDGNDGGDADDDAQHGEQTAHFVAADAGPRHLEILNQSHGSPPPFRSSTTRPSFKVMTR